MHGRRSRDIPRWNKLRLLLQENLGMQPEARTVCVVGIERRRAQAPRSGPFEPDRIMFYCDSMDQIMFRGRTYMPILIF